MNNILFLHWVKHHFIICFPFIWISTRTWLQETSISLETRKCRTGKKFKLGTLSYLLWDTTELGWDQVQHEWHQRNFFGNLTWASRTGREHMSRHTRSVPCSTCNHSGGVDNSVFQAKQNPKPEVISMRKKGAWFVSDSRKDISCTSTHKTSKPFFSRENWAATSSSEWEKKGKAPFPLLAHWQEKFTEHLALPRASEEAVVSPSWEHKHLARPTT